MSLTPGTRIGSYEVQAALGAGGMGEVYRARDVKLGRDVALKLMPSGFAADSARLARFQREAQVLASLNHPHIAQIYGLEEASPSTGADQATGPALVMELVEGVTLADRIGQGNLGLDEALGIARQVAEALEAAHEKGVIHRDLKPANVMVTPAGVVKVLDFGLAAIAEGPGRPHADVSNSPTLTMAATQAGVILGTAGYMSPEQAAGKPVDKRADIWSFGVMLWEALMGKRLFEGETVSHTLADVLRAEIPFATLPSTTPSAIRLLLRRCLDRDLRSRLRDIGEARITIERYLADPIGARDSDSSTGTIGRWSRPVLAAWGVALVALAIAAALAVVSFGTRDSPANAVRFQILPPAGTTFTNAPVLSPDGRRIAFDAPGPDGRPLLWIRALDGIDARPLSGTEGAMAGPFWSPDSRFLTFGTSGFPGQLKKVGVSGGRPQVLADVGSFREGAWNRDGVILFGVASKGLLQVPEAGGTAVPVTLVDTARREVQHAGPAFLPDGRRFLYHRVSDIPENRGIFVGSLDLPPEKQSLTRIIAADSDPVFVPSMDSSGGLVLFLRDGTLYAQAFDGVSQVSGEAVSLAENVGSIGSYGWFSVSSTGDLAFRTGGTAGGTSELTWFDREGKQMGKVGLRGDYGGVQISPDGKKVLTQKAERLSIGAVGSVEGIRTWVADVSRGVFGRLSAGEGGESSPAVSPEGRVAFSSTLNGPLVGDLYWMPDSGVGAPEPLLVKSPTVKHPNDFSPDGKFLVFDDHTANRQDLWILPIEQSPAGGDRKPIPFVVTSADETFGQFSPDGKWIAYTSDEAGRREVYVQGFAPDRVPAAAVGKWTISSAGGDKPRWSKNGKELFYIAPDRRLMAVPVKTGATFEPGVAVPLFETRAQGFFPYAVGHNGWFLVNTRVDVEELTSSPVTIVLNWRAGLRDNTRPR